MNRFLTVLFVVFTYAASAQHVATLSENSDFTTIHNGKIESVFVLDNELSAAELANFNEWKSDNASLMTLNKSGLTVSASFTPDYNNRKVYSKLFYMLGVSEVDMMQNGSLVKMNLDQFFAHFNL